MNQEQLDQMNRYEGPERAAFEETIYQQYFITHATTSGIDPAVVDKKTLMRRTREGEYAQIEVSAMWYGWWHRQSAAGSACVVRHTP